MKSCEINYRKIFENGRYSGLLELADAKILTDDGCSFDVHKVMLARCSDFFRAMFCGFDKGKELCKISSFDGDCVSDILVFIYTEDISVNETNITDLLIASDYFSVRHLYAKIKSQVKSTLTNSNCLRLCQITQLLNKSELFRCCLNFLIPRFEEIIYNQISQFEDFSLNLLKRILSNRNVYFTSERSIWEVIVHWVQALPESRLEHVADLFSTLTIDEVNANLATEIVNHDIVRNNAHMKDLNNTISLIGADRACDAIVDFINVVKTNNFRIPEELTLFSDTASKKLKIFISFDETVDLWHKILEIPYFRPNKLIAVKSKVYFFERNMTHRCFILDLETMKQKLVQNTHLQNCSSIIAVENTFYTIVWENKRCDINEFVVEEGKSRRITSLDDCNFYKISATAIGQNIFIVAGNHWMNKRKIVTRVFNVVTHQWTNLSSPTKCYTVFKLVSYHNKIYLINELCGHLSSPEIEVFDPAMNVWKVLPDLNQTYFNVSFIIFRDKLIIYDINNTSMAGSAELWNDDKECWEVLEKTAANDNMDFRWYLSCTINDTDLIKVLRKRIRNSTVKMEEIRYIL